MTEQDTILTKAEGMALAKKSTPLAFDKWRRKWGVRGRGRYSKHAIEHAMHREATALRRKII
jgi:hypothetical protein